MLESRPWAASELKYGVRATHRGLYMTYPISFNTYVTNTRARDEYVQPMPP